MVTERRAARPTTPRTTDGTQLGGTTLPGGQQAATGYDQYGQQAAAGYDQYGQPIAAGYDQYGGAAAGGYGEGYDQSGGGGGGGGGDGDGWSTHVDESGATYYYNEYTGETQWA